MKPEWFGPRLRELRSAAGLSQDELAERAGLTRAAICQFEIGRREPAWASVLAVCQALRITPDAFIQKPAREFLKRGPGRPPKPQEG